MDFYVGQKVECINNRECHDPAYQLTLGGIYIIRWVGPFNWNNPVFKSPYGVRLHAIERIHPADGTDVPFGCLRFRPIEYKSMSIFRAIAADPSRRLEDA